MNSEFEKYYDSTWENRTDADTTIWSHMKETWNHQQIKIDKLKQLLLLTDPSVADVEMNETTMKQWNEFIKTFPREKLR